jgi:hypothetical protein
MQICVAFTDNARIVGSPPWDYFRLVRDTIRIIETPRYVPYWNGRSDGKSRPARERGQAALPHEARPALGSCSACQAAESALIVT